MSPSTASTKSLCLTLALLALTTSSSAASALNPLPSSNDDSVTAASCSSPGDTDGSVSFESATIITRLPIHLTPTTQEEDGHDTIAQRNASVYYSDDNDAAIEEEEFELPAELAALIANAKKSQDSSPAAAPTLGASATTADDVRYYATYTEGELCSSKSSSLFESWDESYVSLEDCCDVAFSWDYGACMGL
mmetsp:Transcript_16023/g.29052  ORF Transcript_16023/g.29052 Transcript_16023/m.29052 type:complete len:192 (+) Transcript_16023:155-730(+)|eukprot:CAMPEP_0201880798 /NCGR_PEP_ID=MMETSP0902-20130614/11290_1 /ASSEMBLY_ACC=CAM_ASM_000551 /TAXON_ID=420261 /ORGANISM="Thalassiosira antarctica, Strain CCMP982" /LENGTH=191 /DNA_ID=CAMNT_0048408867 /DNA_START=155 /DNA_END=730 /DNA_ORIENTATION=-